MYFTFAGNPIHNVDPLGNVVGVGGSKAHKNAFLARINSGKTQFKYVKGNLELKDPKQKVEGEFASQLYEAIKNPQKIVLRLIPASKDAQTDQFYFGTVDMGDMLKGTNNIFKQNVLHIVTERISVPDYEKKLAEDRLTEADYNVGHDAGLLAEVKFLKELFPKLDTHFWEEDEYKQDEVARTHSYVFIFTDIMLIIKSKYLKADDGNWDRDNYGEVLGYSYEKVKRGDFEELDRKKRQEFELKRKVLNVQY